MLLGLRSLWETPDFVQLVVSATSGAGYSIKVHASWVDLSTGSPGRVNTKIATASTASVVPGPVTGIRSVRLLSIRNDHVTDSCLVEVKRADGDMDVVTLWKGTLPAGESSILNQNGDWDRLDATGTLAR